MRSARSRMLPRIRSWDEYRRVFGRRVLWTAAVRHILARHGLAPASLAKTFPGTCGVLMARMPGGRNLIVKIFPPLLKHDSRIEAICLRHLARCSDIPAPVVLAEGRLKDRVTWEYLVLKARAGRPLRELAGKLNGREAAAVAAQIGRVLRRLHELPPPRQGFPRTRVLTDARAVARLARRAVGVLRRRGAFSQRFLRDLSRRLPRLASSALKRRPVLAHADITEDHVLFIKRNGRWRLSGLIDFADAVIGPRELELMPLWLGAFARNSRSFESLFRAYSPCGRMGRAWRDRAAAFTLLHQFGPSCVLDLLKREGKETSRLTWDELRDWLFPPALEGGSFSARRR